MLITELASVKSAICTDYVDPGSFLILISVRLF